MTTYLGGPPANPFTRLLAAVVGVLALVGAVFFGLFIFAAAIGVGLVLWLVFRVRLWWLGRRLQAAGARPGEPFGRPADGSRPGDDSVIDADYEVVSREQKDR
jgi:hypothetical protein